MCIYVCVCVFIYNYGKENEQLCYFIKLLGAYKFFWLKTN